MAKKIIKHQFNLQYHELVPFHEVISEEKKEEIFKKYNITPDQLPKILNTDPVCVSIGANPGQVVKITRNSHTARTAVAYRLVVESND